MRIVVQSLCLSITLLHSGSSSLAQSPAIPNLVNFQGSLVDSTGEPLETKDYEIIFEIFDSENGGNRVWGPQIFDGLEFDGHGDRVSVVRGHFNVVLGPRDTGQRRIERAFESGQTYVEITLKGQQPLKRRWRILSAPYALRSGFPAGTIIAFGGQAASIPNGWLLCDGSTKKRTEYVALYKAIGDIWQGNDTVDPTAFRLPDLRGTFLRGLDPNGNLDPDGPTRVLGDRQEHSVQRHSHFLVTGANNQSIAEDSLQTAPFIAQGGNSFEDEYHLVGSSPPEIPHIGNSSIFGSSDETRPVNTAVNFIIKY